MKALLLYDENTHFYFFLVKNIVIQEFEWKNMQHLLVQISVIDLITLLIWLLYVYLDRIQIWHKHYPCALDAAG